MAIKGTQEAVVTALQMVSKVLIENGNQEVMPIKDSRTVGAILGRQGANIRKIESDSKASLHLDDAEDGSKRLVIEGTAEQIAKARAMVTDILEGGPIKPTPGEGEVVEEIECPASAVGSIIGKGGSEIKSIQEKTGARLDVPRGSPVAWIVGTKKAVAAATVCDGLYPHVSPGQPTLVLCSMPRALLSPLFSPLTEPRTCTQDSPPCPTHLQKLVKEKIAATVQAEEDRAERARQMAENAAKTTAQFSANADDAAADNETWGRSISGADDSWGSAETGW